MHVTRIKGWKGFAGKVTKKSDVSVMKLPQGLKLLNYKHFGIINKYPVMLDCPERINHRHDSKSFGFATYFIQLQTMVRSSLLS